MKIVSLWKFPKGNTFQMKDNANGKTYTTKMNKTSAKQLHLHFDCALFCMSLATEKIRAYCCLPLAEVVKMR